MQDHTKINDFPAESTGNDSASALNNDPKPWIAVGREEIRHVFTNDERIALGKQWVTAYNERVSNEAIAKQEAADWKAEIKKNKALEEQIKQKLEEGQEYKWVDLEIKFHSPKRGMKQVIRIDNREIIRTVEMTTAELQIQPQLVTWA